MAYSKPLILFALSSSFGSAMTTVTFGPLSDDSASINVSGFGSSPSGDYLGIVVNTAPLQIDAGSTTVGSDFAPGLGDVIGRDLASTGADFTNSVISWQVDLPPVPANFIPGTFNVTATFASQLEFGGAVFSSTQPNALNFELLLGVSSVATFQAQSGNHTSATLSGNQVSGDPVTTVTVTATFPNGNSFNADSEQFRLFSDSLVVEGSFQIPEPSTALLGGLALLGLLRRRR